MSEEDSNRSHIDQITKIYEDKKNKKDLFTKLYWVLIIAIILIVILVFWYWGSVPVKHQEEEE